MTHFPAGVRGFVWKWGSHSVVSVTLRPASQTCSQNRSYSKNRGFSQSLGMGTELGIWSMSGTGMLLPSWEIMSHCTRLSCLLTFQVL